MTKRAWPTHKRIAATEPHTSTQGASEHRAALEAIDEISKVLDANLSRRETFAEIARIAKEVTHTNAAQIFLLSDSNDLLLLADTSEPEKVGFVRIRLGQGLTGWAAEKRTAVAIKREPWADPRYYDHPALNERSFQSLLCVPLILSNELIGVVNVRTHGPYGYTQREASILSKIANEVARAIRQQSKVETLATKAERFEAVSEVSGAIAKSPYVEEILQLLVTFTAERLNYKVVTVRLLDEERQELVLRATQSENFAYRRKRSLKVGESFAGRALLTKLSVTVPDISATDEYVGPDLAEVQGLRGMACIPLLVGDKAVGVMTCYTEEPHDFSRVELRALEALAKQAALALERARLHVRNTLMQETHHRVKNSLQQVASLIRLQLAEAPDLPMEAAMTDVLNRIIAIAGVHDLLSSQDLDRIGILALAETLANHQQQMMMSPSRSVPITVGGVNAAIEMNAATQVALILNELIQNAVEHGFENIEEGRIHIEIMNPTNEIVFCVSNSGRKLPSKFDPSVDSHLGLKIVDILVRAIGGRFTLESKFNWVVATVRVPITVSG
ncbi:MAG: GAF domain-containing protein [Fimbriimonadales bacterium]